MFRKILIALVLLFAFGSNCCSGARHFPARILPNKSVYVQSTVRLTGYRQREDGTYAKHRCTGALVSADGLVLTAKHCTENTSLVYVQSHTMGVGRATILREDSVADLALIAIDGYSHVPFEICEPYGIDEGVCAIGTTWDDDLFHFECGDITAGNGELVVTTTQLRGGFSGGPLVHIEGECLAGISYSCWQYPHGQRCNHVGLDAINLILEDYR